MVLGVLMVLMAQRARAQVGPARRPSRPSGTNQVEIGWLADTNLSVLQELLAFGRTNFWSDVPDAPSIFGARYGIYRDATNGASFYRLASRGRRGFPHRRIPLPMRPRSCRTALTDLGSSTAFLYTGSHAVQIGVSLGTIAPARAAVLRGKVTKRDSSALPAVRVAILNHPEYGYTFTRQDGMFDLAVNAGLYTLDFEAVGYCRAQRQVEAPWEDFSDHSGIS